MGRGYETDSLGMCLGTQQIEDASGLAWKEPILDLFDDQASARGYFGRSMLSPKREERCDNGEVPQRPIAHELRRDRERVVASLLDERDHHIDEAVLRQSALSESVLAQLGLKQSGNELRKPTPSLAITTECVGHR